jgi:hypothetical protein
MEIPQMAVLITWDTARMNLTTNLSYVLYMCVYLFNVLFHFSEASLAPHWVTCSTIDVASTEGASYLEQRLLNIHNRI